MRIFICLHVYMHCRSYSMSRTLANSTEAVLLTLSIQLWIATYKNYLKIRVRSSSDFNHVRKRYFPFIQWEYALSGVSVWCRPTAISFWCLPMLLELTSRLRLVSQDKYTRQWSLSMKRVLYIRIISSSGICLFLYTK